MQGSEAITRIKEGLGFLSESHHDARILARLQEAQRELEKGKSLPKFLLQEDQTIVLAAGDRTAPLPTGFIRVNDDERPHYLPTNSTIPVFLSRRYFTDASLAYQRYESGSVITSPNVDAPKVYVIRKSTIDFMVRASDAFTIYWSYYKAADAVAAGAENAWLANAPEWLIGEAGMRMAADMRDGDAIAIFKEMATKGRAAQFGEQVAQEEADGPLVLGGAN